ncbi:MAG: DUF1565 domain-containing protein, partial [Prolixibacteraceae bacterium]
MKYLIALYFVFFILVSHAQGQSFYVSPKGNDKNPGTGQQPFRTIQKAIDASVGKSVETIYLKEGVYQLKKPLIFKPEHSGGNAYLKIQNYGRDKAVISGGKKIGGWQQQQNGWWVCDIPEVKSGDWKFRQIYVNGQLRHRARKPNNGFLIVKGMPEGTPKTVHYHTDYQSFEFAEGDIQPNWKNMDDVEVIVYHFWTDSHLPIQSIDEESNIVTLKHKAGKTFTDDFSDNGARYIVENV